jgi:hypothetical protein
MSKRIALVIGNQNYGGNARPLQGPKNDAVRMAALFERLGFDLIQPQFDADYGTIRRSVRLFGEVLEKGGIAAFFYSGHGIQGPEGENYLLPVDARLHEPDDIARICYPVRNVLEKIRRVGCTGLLFLDACRDDPFEGVPDVERTKSVVILRPGLGKVDAGELQDVLISYATGPGNTALDGDADHPSHYTAALLAHLGTPGVPIEALLKRVRQQVRDATEMRQIPWEEASLLQDVVLVPAPKAAADPAVKPAPVVDPRPPGNVVPPARPEPAASPDPALPGQQARPPGGPSQTDSGSPPTLGQTSIAWLRKGFRVGRVLGLAGLLLMVSAIVFNVGPELVERFLRPASAPGCDPATPAGAIACRVKDLDHQEKQVRVDLAKEVDAALAGTSLTADAKVQIVDALLLLTEPASLVAMSHNGRFNLIERLATVPSTLWFDPNLLEQLETAHRSIAAIDAEQERSRVLGQLTSQSLSDWKAVVGYVDRSSITVYPHYYGLQVNGFERVRLALRNGWGWKVEAIDAEENAAGIAQVRYGSDDMKASAMLMAAQLNGQIAPRASDPTSGRVAADAIAEADLPQLRAVKNRAIGRRNLEIWVGR